MSSPNSKAYLGQLISASFDLSKIITASEQKHEGFSQSYMDNPDAFRQMIASGLKTERLLKTYLSELATHIVVNTNWENYQNRIITGAEPEPLILYRGGKDVSTSNILTPGGDVFGISTSTSPTVARAFAKASDSNNVIELILSPAAKIKRVDTGGMGIDHVYTYDDLKNLAAKGYDAVLDTSITAEQEVRVLTQSAIASTRAVSLDMPKVPVGSDLWGSTINWEGQNLNLQITFNNGLSGAMAAGILAAHSQAGIATQILPTDAPAIKAMREYGLSRAKLITDATKNKVKESLISSMQQGLSKQDAAAQLVKVVGDPARANIIAHTEQVQAFSLGRKTVGDEVGARWKVWDNGQPRACVWCENLDGKKIRWDDNFESGRFSVWASPLHPYCYCGWHMVL